MNGKLGAFAGASLAALSLAGCATAPSITSPSSAPAASQAATTPADRVNKAMELLLQAKPAEARAQLMSALKDQPTNDTARKLLNQIDTDPKALFGPKTYPYKARPGDTASGLASRFLGDPLMFYALARLNGIDPPSKALDGLTVMIPGEPKPVVRATPKAAAAAPPPVAKRDPARANQLRAQGLVQLNQGAIGRAVSLLQQAVALDPDNAAIKHDLDRAQRIQRTVQKK
jgi:tetratricopeptide (TPR) repeat protein